MKKSGPGFSSNYSINTPIAFVVIVLLFIIFTPGHSFIDPRNLASMGKLIPDLGIVALGVGMLMIAGEFDLSIASVIPLCSFVFVTLLMKGMNPVLALIIVILVGAALGFINGTIVVKTGLPSFIITLSTLMFWRGVVYLLSRMTQGINWHNWSFSFTDNMVYSDCDYWLIFYKACWTRFPNHTSRTAPCGEPV